MYHDYAPRVYSVARRMVASDVDAEDVGDDAFDEGELAVALAEDGLDAFAHAFAAGFQVLQQLLPRNQAAAVLPGRAKLLADLSDLEVELGGQTGAQA